MLRTPSGLRPRAPKRVFAVGQHVFINCPGDRSRSAPLGDERGESVSSAELADGVDVEVLAWRPRTPTGPRYRVRVLSNGTDGWLAAAHLRTVFVPMPDPTSESPPPATAVSDPGGRPFGRHTRPDAPRPAESPTPAQPTPVGDAVGRRFGQRS